MNAFKLMVNERHFDQRIKVELAIVVDEAFQCGHMVNDHTGTLRWYKDSAAGALIFQHCSRDSCGIRRCILSAGNIIQPASRW